MELDTQKLLFERLDQSLWDHAHALVNKKGVPDISDIYKLADLADRHHYLRVNHQFTPAEVDALLKFKDPLVVADACWSENEHGGTFPICEIMDEIDAYNRFPMTVPLSKRVEELMAVIERNYAEYTASLMDMSKEELVEKSLEIAAMRNAHAFILDNFSFDLTEVNNLLKLKNPLYFLADNWLLPVEDHGFVHDILADLNSPQYLQKYIERTPAQDKKPSVREQLRNAVQAVSQRLPTERRPHGNEVR